MEKQTERDLSQCKIVFIVGAPGCGKATQAKKLADDFGYTHISMSELLRSESKKVNRLEKENSVRNACPKESRTKGMPYQMSKWSIWYGKRLCVIKATKLW